MKKKIAIIGAGIAGLTLANFLKKDSNFEFMLYEKEPSLTLEEGFGIQLATNSISILNKIGFSKINSENIFHPKNLDFYTIKNEKICDLDLAQFNSESYKYTTLKRSSLIEFLKDEIYTQNLRFGKQIQEVRELKGKILIKFDDNTNDLVDFVIGADGIFSNTKSFFEKKKVKPTFKNAIAIRTVLQSKENLQINHNNISILMGSNLHLVVYPINKKKELNLVSVLRTKDKNPSNISSLIKQNVLTQNQNLEYLFKNEIKLWPLYSSKITPSSNQKVFYIGDAFNGFLPTLAQGAGQSIESAYELFNLLKDNNLNASNLYFKSRSERAKIIERRSNLNFFVFHFSSFTMQKIRNYFLKFLIKRKFFINNFLRKVYKN